MLLDFKHVVRHFKMNIRGIIQVGAHYGQEVAVYRACRISNIALIEPCKDAFIRLQDAFGNDKEIELFNFACGDENTIAQMFTEHSNQGQSNSLLEPLVHLTEHKEIVFNDRETVQVKKLDNIPFLPGKNLLNMDCQGYELHVLKGATQTLKQIDYIFTEVNRHEMYKGCVLVEDLDKYLVDFARVATGWASAHHGWGDSLYIRKSLL